MLLLSSLSLFILSLISSITLTLSKLSTSPSSLSALPSPSSLSSGLWYRRLALVIFAFGLTVPAVSAQDTVTNITLSSVQVSPEDAWSLTDQGLATNSINAAAFFICSKPCTAIAFEILQPEGQQGQISACLNCVDSQQGLPVNLTSSVLTDPATLISVDGLPPALNTFEIVSHSTTPLVISSLQAIFASADSSDDNNNGSSTSSSITTTATTSSSSTTSTSTSSSSTSMSTSSSSSSLSSSSSHSSTTAIVVAVVLILLALIAGSIFFIYRRRKQQKRWGGGGGFSFGSFFRGLGRRGGGGLASGERRKSAFPQIITWPRAASYEELQRQKNGDGGYDEGNGRDGDPTSPMLETLRSSRDLEAEYGFGPYGTGGRGVVGNGFGDSKPSGSLTGAGSGVGPGPGYGASLSTISERDEDRPSPQRSKSSKSGAPVRRNTQPSVYSAYSDPWQLTGEEYNHSAESSYEDEGGDDDYDDDDEQGHITPRDRLKANLHLNTSTNNNNNKDNKRTTSVRSKRYTRSTAGVGGPRKRDTSMSTYSTKTPLAVKSMLSELNDAIRSGADKFAWKKSMQPNVPPLPTTNVPMQQFLSPDSAAAAAAVARNKSGKGHKPSRSTDVLI